MGYVYRQDTGLACQTPKTSFWLVRMHPKTSPNKAMDLLLYLGCRYARFFLKKRLFIVSKIQEIHERPVIKKFMRKRKCTARRIVILQPKKGTT